MEIQLLNGLIREVGYMRVELCTRYYADDGAEFDDMQECVAYESELQRRRNEQAKTKYIIKNRGQGKTNDIIALSSELNVPIVTKTNTMAKFIKERAELKDIPIPKPIVLDDLRNA